MAGLLRHRQHREQEKSQQQEEDLHGKNSDWQQETVCQWNSCSGQKTQLNNFINSNNKKATTTTTTTSTKANTTMCSPPSWKSSEGDDVEGDYSVWSSNKEDGDEDSDWSPEAEGKVPLIFYSIIPSSHRFVCCWSYLFLHPSFCCSATQHHRLGSLNSWGVGNHRF